jgi:hypothetical protein
MSDLSAHTKLESFFKLASLRSHQVDSESSIQEFILQFLSKGSIGTTYTTKFSIYMYTWFLCLLRLPFGSLLRIIA